MKINPELEKQILSTPGISVTTVNLPDAAPALPDWRDEKAFMADVIRYAKQQGWRCYHTHNSRKSEPGFFDLVMVRGCRLVFAELKANSEWTPAQREWYGAMCAVAAMNVNIDVFVWYPSDWPQIQKVLA
jgi:hypothetical protein